MAATQTELAVLLDRIALLEQRLDVSHEKEVTLTENTNGSAIPVSDDSGTKNGTSDEDPKEEDKDTEPKSRARILISKFDSKTGERRDYSSKEEAPKAQDKDHAFLLRKKLGLSGEGEGGELEILSPELWTKIQKILSEYPYHSFLNNPSTIESPYEPFVLYWDSLEDAAKESSEVGKDAETRADLKLLLNTLSNGSGDTKLDKYFNTRKALKEQKCITFETLWTLFTPGALVYGRPFLEQDQLFIVEDNWRPWPNPTATTWYLQCWIYDWDGKRFRRMSLRMDIEKFDGQKPINSLPFYPFEYHTDREKLKETLKARGETYRRVCTTKEGSRMFEYRGDVVVSKTGITGIKANNDEQKDSNAQSNQIQMMDEVSAISSSKPINIESRVMVDFDSYFKYGPTVATVGNLKSDPFMEMCNCQECQDDSGKQKMSRRRFDSDAFQEQERWEEEQYLLCPPRVLGYLLLDKKWAQLDVGKLVSIPKQDPERSWGRIVLPDGDITKKLVLDLVNGHQATESESDESGLTVDDIVPKKGKGLVILLYGPPGVGKTSTAETVAIAARKPLFAISVADVGTKPEYVEANLAKIFDLATTWQAILLIDEADVFLTSRGQSEFSSTDRNALVSVFLRVLEYYQGILMLTTNQIAQFDVAVQSRIHVAIKYTQLSPDQIIAIFNGFLEPLRKKGCLDDAAGIKEWVKEEMSEADLDGRQIRNIVTSALALARAEKKSKLDKKTLKRISNNVKSYKKDFIVQFERYKNSQDGSKH